jgi:nicotinamidase-related amidase
VPERDALIVVDMLNTYEHDDAEPLMDCVRERLPNIERMIAAAREADALLVYVNDCFGNWSANARTLTEQALAGRAPDLVEPIVPRDDDPFVIKARHSIFYQSQVEYMLRQEGVSRIVLVGQVTEQCILYSALDGYVRHFEVAVAPDAVAHIRDDLAAAAIRMMEHNMHAHLVPADASAFERGT